MRVADMVLPLGCIRQGAHALERTEALVAEVAVLRVLDGNPANRWHAANRLPCGALCLRHSSVGDPSRVHILQAPQRPPCKCRKHMRLLLAHATTTAPPT